MKKWVHLSWAAVLLFIVSAAGSVTLTGCVVERTVKDSNGNVIIQEPTVANPFESQEEQLKAVRAREEELGW
jgi:hypothetical protein